MTRGRTTEVNGSRFEPDNGLDTSALSSLAPLSAPISSNPEIIGWLARASISNIAIVDLDYLETNPIPFVYSRTFDLAREAKDFTFAISDIDLNSRMQLIMNVNSSLKYLEYLREEISLISRISVQPLELAKDLIASDRELDNEAVTYFLRDSIKQELIDKQNDYCCGFIRTQNLLEPAIINASHFAKDLKPRLDSPLWIKFADIETGLRLLSKLVSNQQLYFEFAYDQSKAVVDFLSSPLPAHKNSAA